MYRLPGVCLSRLQKDLCPCNKIEKGLSLFSVNSRFFTRHVYSETNKQKRETVSLHKKKFTLFGILSINNDNNNNSFIFSHKK